MDRATLVSLCLTAFFLSALQFVRPQSIARRIRHTALHAIVPVRKRGAEGNDPVPEGSGQMTSIELVKKRAALGGEKRDHVSGRTSDESSGPFRSRSLYSYFVTRNS